MALFAVLAPQLAVCQESYLFYKIKSLIDSSNRVVTQRQMTVTLPIALSVAAAFVGKPRHVPVAGRRKFIKTRRIRSVTAESP